MPRSKCLAYNDEQLRILLCIAGYGPLSLTDLVSTTGIKTSNLSTEINNLISTKILKKDKGPQNKRRGRPREYLALKSPWILLSICDELEYRKYQYESEMKKLNSRMNNEFWADWFEIANDPDEGKRQDFLDKYNEIIRERINLGAEDGSFSAKADLADIDGQKIIVWQQYDGRLSSTKEISYQGIIFWLQLLQNPTLRILGFLMDNAAKDHSAEEIADAICLETDIVSGIMPKLEASQKIVSMRKDQTKTFKLNIKNQKVKRQMGGGLRKVNFDNLSKRLQQGQRFENK
jgi:hypothetical protein